MKKLLFLILLAALLSLAACAPVDRRGGEAPVATTGQVEAPTEATDVHGDDDEGGEEPATLAPIDSSRVLVYEDGVRVSLMDENDEVQYKTVIFDEYNEETAFDKHSYILAGTAKNIRKIKTEYEWTQRISYTTLFDFEISKVVYQKQPSDGARVRALAEGDVISMAAMNNSFACMEGLPIVEEGKEFLIFCERTDVILQPDKRSDSEKVLRMIDYWCIDTLHLLAERVGDRYLVDTCFEDYLTSEQIIKLVDENGEPLKDELSAAAGAIVNERRGRTEAEWLSLYDLVPCEAFENAIAARAEAYNGGER